MARVLIVEEEPSIRHLLDDFFTREGFDTLLAETGVSAIALASTVRPDIILIDVMLPDTDIAIATQMLRTHDATHSIPIVAMSANTLALREAATLLPVDDTIAKPFDLDELLHIVSAHVGVSTSEAA